MAVASLSQQVAEGTSLAVIVPTALVATLVHSRAGRIDWPTASFLGLGAIGGGVLGAEVALALDPTLLRRLFAAWLVLAGLRMLKRTRRPPQAPPSQ